jgi:hypothetical protein
MRVEFVLAAGSTEPAVAFPTFAAVLAFGTASIALLWPLMKGVEDRTKALKDAMPDKTGSLTRDFTILERIIYSIAGIAWILAYSFQGARPWLKGLRQYLKAGSWLTERQKER